MAEKNKRTILIADDAGINRSILVRGLEEEYNIIEAVDGEDALKKIAENYKKLSALLLDIGMPKFDGFQIMENMNKKNLNRYIPVILITGDSSDETRRKGYQYGAVEFITKPFDMTAVSHCIANVVKIYDEKKLLEIRIIQQNRELKAQAEKLQEINEKLTDMLGSIVEFRGAESNSHIQKVKRFTRLLAGSFATYFPDYKLSETDIAYITSASCLHDIGKILIPDSILFKPSKLTADEFEIIKSHTTKGCEIIDTMAAYQSELHQKYTYEICRYHHERYDGRGYPEGLCGDEIPISAQLVSVAEAFDALMTNSVYKEGIPFEKAFTMIIEGDCGIFSPNIIQCFKLCKEKLMNIVQDYE